jgi:ribosomal-protein-alanine N-acetyltransferase
MTFFTDPEVQQYLGHILIPKDEADAKRWIDNLNGRCLKARLVFTWCVEEKATGAVIGRCDLGGFVRKSMAETSYYLSREYWHRGMMTEALMAVISFGFESLGLHRVQAYVRPENTASLRLLAKVGFCEEGRLRQYDFGNEFHDVVMLSMLADEYRTKPEISSAE